MRPIDELGIALLSALGGDPDSGVPLWSAVNKAGAAGVILLDESLSGSFEQQHIGGLRLDQGFISQVFVTDSKREEAVVESPHILVADVRISAAIDIEPILERVRSTSGSIVVIAQGVSGEALATLIDHKSRGILDCMAIRASGFGDRQTAVLEDIATVTGGRVIGTDSDNRLPDAALEDIGRADRVIAREHETIIVGKLGDPDEIANRLRHIRSQIDGEAVDFVRARLQERLASLSGGVTRIGVPGATPEARRERIRWCEHALRIVRSALGRGWSEDDPTPLEHVLKDEIVGAQDPWRRHAVEAAGALELRALQPVLTKVCREESDAHLRESALASLSSLGVPPSEVALEQLDMAHGVTSGDFIRVPVTLVNRGAGPGFHVGLAFSGPAVGAHAVKTEPCPEIGPGESVATECLWQPQGTGSLLYRLEVAFDDARGPGQKTSREGFLEFGAGYGPTVDTHAAPDTREIVRRIQELARDIDKHFQDR